jgi:HSP20 family protein
MEETMAITPYRASSDLLGSVFDDLLRPAGGWSGRMTGLLRAPEADVIERQDGIRVMVELPGMAAEDIGLDLENNVLTISGDKREESREDADACHLSERRYGKFSRSFVLPRDVDPEGIEARFENGVLTVAIPKSEKAGRQRIEVRDGGGQQRVAPENGGDS